MEVVISHIAVELSYTMYLMLNIVDMYSQNIVAVMSHV